MRIFNTLTKSDDKIICLARNWSVDKLIDTGSSQIYWHMLHLLESNIHEEKWVIIAVIYQSTQIIAQMR